MSRNQSVQLWSYSNALEHVKRVNLHARKVVCAFHCGFNAMETSTVMIAVTNLVALHIRRSISNASILVLSYTKAGSVMATKIARTAVMKR